MRKRHIKAVSVPKMAQTNFWYIAPLWKIPEWWEMHGKTKPVS